MWCVFSGLLNNIICLHCPHDHNFYYPYKLALPEDIMKLIKTTSIVLDFILNLLALILSSIHLKSFLVLQ